jgi:hypothetical protein
MDARRLPLIVAGICVLAAQARAADAETAAAQPPPAARCEHVYIFLINGVDPFDLCGLDKMPEYLRSQGYEHVYFGALTTSRRRFYRDIRHIRAADPCARVVLIGFSAGANVACRITDDLAADGEQVDLLVYLGGCLISNSPAWKPRNAGRVVNIRDSGLVFLGGGVMSSGDQVSGADNVQIPGISLHVDTPAQPVTQDTLARELAAQAAAVPDPPAKP